MVSATTQLKLTANDGKKYKSDALDAEGIILLASEFPGRVNADFVKWFTRSEETIDGKSKQKAYELFDSSLFDEINDREMFMKGIDCSYYYEEVEN